MSKLATLDGTLDAVWRALSEGVADGSAPCRNCVLATVGDGGAARMVVLRGADRAAATVEVHSDTETEKVRDLRADPRATLLFWLPDARLQIRLRATFSELSGTAVEPRWRAIPEGPRRAYGGRPFSGSVLSDPCDHDATPQRDRFAVLIGRIDSIDTLHLGDLHRRALFQQADGFGGRWIAP